MSLVDQCSLFLVTEINNHFQSVTGETSINMGDQCSWVIKEVNDTGIFSFPRWLPWRSQVILGMDFLSNRQILILPQEPNWWPPPQLIPRVMKIYCPQLPSFCFLDPLHTLSICSCDLVTIRISSDAIAREMDAINSELEVIRFDVVW